MTHHIILSSYNSRWWVGCYICYRGPPSPLLAVPNVTVHPSMASVPITVLLYNGPLLCVFNVGIKGLSMNTIRSHQQHISRDVTSVCGPKFSLNTHTAPHLCSDRSQLHTCQVSCLHLKRLQCYRANAWMDAQTDGWMLMLMTWDLKSLPCEYGGPTTGDHIKQSR